MRQARQGQHYGTLVTREAPCLENHHTTAELLTGLSLLGLPKAVCLKELCHSSHSQPGKEFYTSHCTSVSKTKLWLWL